MSTLSKIHCCICGDWIEPNDAAMCVQCIITVDRKDQKQKGKFDAKDDVLHEVVQCSKCDRWQVKNNSWIHHELESPGLLSLLLKKLPRYSSIILIVINIA